MSRKLSLSQALIEASNASKQSRFDDAILIYRAILKSQPNNSTAQKNLQKIEKYQYIPENGRGIEFKDLANLDKKISDLKAKINSSIHSPKEHFNLSLLYLLKGDFINGWKEYEYRRKCSDYKSSLPNSRNSLPCWDGSQLNGRSVFIYEEQGVGDTFHFSRYLRNIKKEFGDGVVIFGCRSSIVDFYYGKDSGWSKYIDKVLLPGDKIPKFDMHLPLLSIPFIMNLGIENLSVDVPYLTPPKNLVDNYREKILNECKPNKLKVGLAWQGAKDNVNDKTRSISLRSFSSLLHLEDVQFFSLQRGFGCEQIKENGFETKLIDWSNDFEKYIDTAALVENLDLIISVDTSIVHLSGAMGKDTWVLLESVPDFRWMLDREDSPLYPSMRLFRQSQPDDWTELLNRVEIELRKKLNNYGNLIYLTSMSN